MLCYNCSSHLLARGLPSSSGAIPAFRSSRATRSTFPSRPYCFPVSSRAVRLTFQSCSFRRALFARNFRPARAFFSLRCAPFAQLSHSSVRFLLRRALLVRRLFLSIPSPVLSRVALFVLTALSFFHRVLLYSTNNFAMWWFARQIVIPGFGLIQLFCVFLCACVIFY